MSYSSWSPNRRRRCGNVEIGRFCFWRDFQAPGEAWKKSRSYLRTLSRRWTDFSTLSTARHFHSEYCGAFGLYQRGRKFCAVR